MASEITCFLNSCQRLTSELESEAITNTPKQVKMIIAPKIHFSEVRMNN
jgi:hypothetical protein